MKHFLLNTAKRLLDVRDRVVRKPDQFDLKHGVMTAGLVRAVKTASPSSLRGNRYEPCDTEGLVWAIERGVTDFPSTNFIDVGCGKGRALVVASTHNFRRIIGVEYSSALADLARQNAPKAEIHLEDALDFRFPPGPNFVFFYNPFRDPAILSAVLNSLLAQKTLGVAYQGPGNAPLTTCDHLRYFGNYNSTCLFVSKHDVDSGGRG